ncbi:MAG: hypothetical protein M1825_001195 [Sarcosagium campestre]|nr:MAG: hypothetical protein M1825_001195 [Sarcosagium campestre]
MKSAVTKVMHIHLRRAIPPPRISSFNARRLNTRCVELFPSRSYHAASRNRSDLTAKDRGPTSTEDTQTDFSALDVLGGSPGPTTAIEACVSDGFLLDNGVAIRGGNGCLLFGGEAFTWSPWKLSGGKGLINSKGQWGCDEKAWGVLELLWPKPGLGPSMRPIAPATREYISSLGIRLDVQDTRNAAANFNLLATERGVRDVAAAMVPIGYRD